MKYPDTNANGRRPESAAAERGSPKNAAGAPAAVALLRCLAAAALCASLAASASSIAVKRGQTKVDPAILPLVCLEIGTRGIALPLDTLVIENMATHEELTMYLTNSFNTSHPDMLTAAAPGPISLSLPILRLKPGKYRVKSIGFVSGGASSMTLDLAQNGIFWFEVRDACVNYVGGIEVYADWNRIRRAMGGPVLNNETKRAQVSTVVTPRATARRDAKWVCDVDPGMLALPMALSQVGGN